MPMVPGAGAVVAGWIPVLTVGEVGQGWQLGRHGNVGNPIEESQGGVAHWRGLLAAVAARRRGSPVLHRRSGGWSWWLG
jgi:hypothetical protein